MVGETHGHYHVLGEPREKPAVVQAEEVSEWVKAAGAARQKWFDTLGVGYDVRIEGEQLVGATLVVEGHPVHLELFQEEPRRTEQPQKCANYLIQYISHVLG